MAEYLLCSLHGCLVLLCKVTHLLEPQYFQTFHSQSLRENQTLNTQKTNSSLSKMQALPTYRSRLFVMFVCYQFSVNKNNSQSNRCNHRVARSLEMFQDIVFQEIQWTIFMGVHQGAKLVLTRVDKNHYF